ncbi:MAG: SDR family NAD(P)-dependent oxidoreductase [Acidimicrobiales bacterium]
MTGASSGLGAHFSAVLANAGAEVIAAARRVERVTALAESSPRIHPVACDVTMGQNREDLVSFATDRFGRVDICVNNAGISSGGAKEQATVPAFEAVLQVNLTALFAMSQLVAKAMREHGSGSIINVSSMFGSVASTPYPDAGYVASKSAVNGLTRELAVQWARKGVRVNAIAPGWFESEMNEELLRHAPSRKYVETNCPMGRIGRIDEFDGVLLFLASDASSYCTGQVIAIDGGWTVK